MTIEETFKKAEEGGYDFSKYLPAFPPKYFNETKLKILLRAVQEKILLDPDFWRTLGRSLKWHNDSCDLPKTSPRCSHHHFGPGLNCREWLYQWHGLIDWLAEGKSIENFFKQEVINFGK